MCVSVCLCVSNNVGIVFIFFADAYLHRRSSNVPESILYGTNTHFACNAQADTRLNGIILDEEHYVRRTNGKFATIAIYHFAIAYGSDEAWARESTEEKKRINKIAGKKEKYGIEEVK